MIRRRLLFAGGVAAIGGLALLAFVASFGGSQSNLGGACGFSGSLLAFLGIIVVAVAWESAPGDLKHAGPVPSMPEIFAAVAGRAAKREAAGLLVWGVVCMGIGGSRFAAGPPNALLALSGLVMATAGVALLWRASLAVFVTAGAVLAIAGIWIVGAVFLGWALGEPALPGQALWGVLGLIQCIWAYCAVKRANDWQALLGRMGTSPTPEARCYLAWLLSTSTGNPSAVSLFHRRIGLGPAPRRGRAYVSSRDVLVVDGRGCACFALSFDEAERGLAGASVWDSMGVERVLAVKSDQAEKLRRMMAAAMPVSQDGPAATA